MEKTNDKLIKKIDWTTTIIPLVGIVALCALFMLLPGQSAVVVGNIREFLGDTMGSYYVVGFIC